MSRSKVVRKARKIDSDAIYGSKLISKIINCAMVDGKKSTSMSGIYGALAKIQSFIAEEYRKSNGSPIDQAEMTVWFVEEAINKISPAVEIKSRRIGGANYQIPVALSPRRRLSLAIRWLVSGARIRKERGMVDKFASEMCDIFHDRGESVKKRDTMHKTAEANKAFAHYGANG